MLHSSYKCHGLMLCYCVQDELVSKCSELDKLKKEYNEVQESLKSQLSNSKQLQDEVCTGACVRHTEYSGTSDKVEPPIKWNRVELHNKDTIQKLYKFSCIFNLQEEDTSLYVKDKNCLF